MCPCLCGANNSRETGQGKTRKRSCFSYSWRSPPPASIGQYEYFSLSLLYPHDCPGDLSYYSMTTTAPTRCNDEIQKLFAPGERHYFRRSVNSECQTHTGSSDGLRKNSPRVLTPSDRRRNSSLLTHGWRLRDSPLVTVDISHTYASCLVKLAVAAIAKYLPWTIARYN